MRSLFNENRAIGQAPIVNRQQLIVNRQSSVVNCNASLRVVFAGGGTGGHVYLGIALARELLSRDSGREMLFIGTERGMESRILPSEGFRVAFIVSRGLKRVGVADLFRNLFLIPGSLLQSRRLLSGFRPDAVVGVGGYSSGPVVLAAWLLRLPTMIVEPNAYPGLTNRLLARFIDRAALAMPAAGGCFGSRGVVTGIPVRPEFRSMPDRDHGPGSITVLVYGGSQGSHALNSILCDALPALKQLGPGLKVIHQTGDREIEVVRSAYAQSGVDADVRPFLPRIYEEYAEADLIISRAGAGTVAEITAAGRAAILVPFPGAADDHQTRNASALAEAGAAVQIAESDLRSGRLAEEVRQLMEHPEKLRKMEAASRSLAKPDAAARIADLIEGLASRRCSVT